jgi:hypothetical protein
MGKCKKAANNKDVWCKMDAIAGEDENYGR